MVHYIYDVPDFVQGLTNPDAYAAAHPGLTVGEYCDWSGNDDGVVDGRDVQGFVNAFLGS